jgi:hypothetical protein
VIASAVSTPWGGLTTGVSMTLLPTFGTHCISAACILAMTKSLTIVAAQRVWNVQFDTDVDFQLFISFFQDVFDFNDSLWTKLSVIAMTTQHVFRVR